MRPGDAGSALIARQSSPSRRGGRRSSAGLEPGRASSARVELGLVYGLVALGVFLSFRVLNFPDLTVDGSFPLGAAVAASAIVAGVNPWLATLLAHLRRARSPAW